MNIEPIAYIRTDFGSKFGVPRQSGVANKLEGKIVFREEYRVAEALRGLDGFDYLWLLWDFSEVSSKAERVLAESRVAESGKLKAESFLEQRDADESGVAESGKQKAESSWGESKRAWRPTVRPPRLGGNVRMGVFATRSPFRPNNIGLSSVRIERIELESKEGPVIYVTGADLMDGTPIYDIKPYLPYTDAHPDARGGFTDRLEANIPLLEVEIPEGVARQLSPTRLEALKQILAADPRPHYQQDAERLYGMTFAGMEIRFRVNEGRVRVIEE